MTFSWILACLPLLASGGMGLGAFFNPGWAARLVRLSESAPGGFAEFRATYGGVFLGSHAAALLLIVGYLNSGKDVIAVTAGGAVFVLGFAYLASAAGRALSMLRDKTRTAFNLGSAAYEAACAFCLFAPWIVGLS